MGTMQTQMEKAGFKLSESDQKKVKDSLTNLKKKLKTTTCRKCGESIKFVEVEGRTVPYDLDGIAHWQTCSYSSFTQKKASLEIMKKLAVLFILKYGLNLESEAGLTKKEVQIVHAILEKIFKEEANPVKATIEQDDDGKVDDEIQFKPIPCDSVGDPDEERAPSEDLVHEIEEKIQEEKTLDLGVEKVIAEPITDPDALVIPKNTPIL